MELSNRQPVSIDFYRRQLTFLSIYSALSCFISYSFLGFAPFTISLILFVFYLVLTLLLSYLLDFKFIEISNKYLSLIIILLFAVFVPELHYESMFVAIIAIFRLFLEKDKSKSTRIFKVYFIYSLILQTYEIISLRAIHQFDTYYCLENSGIILFITMLYMSIQRLNQNHIINFHLLEKNQDHLKQSISNIPTNLLNIDIDGNFLFGSKNATELFGLPQGLSKNEYKELASFDKRIYPEDLQTLFDSIQQIKQDKEPRRLKLRAFKYDNSIIHLSGGISPTYDLDGNHSGYAMAYNDESEMYKTKQALEVVNEKYKNLIENLPECIILCDYQANIQYVSPQCLVDFSYLNVNKNFLDCFVNNEKEKIRSLILQIENDPSSKAKNQTFRMMCPDSDEEKMIRLSALPYNNNQENNLLIIFSDITEEYTIAKEKNEIESNYKSIFDSLPIGISVGKEGRILKANKELQNMLGYDEQHFLSIEATSLIYEEDRHIFNAMVVELNNFKIKNADLVIRFVHKDGHLIYGAMRLVLRFDEKGMYKNTLVSISDITKRYTAQLENEKLQTNLNAILNSSKDGVYAIDREFNVLFINEVAKKDFLTEGFALKTGDNLNNVIPKQTLEQWNRKYFKKIFEGKTMTYSGKVEVAGKDKYFENSYSPIKNSNNEIIGSVEISRDITNDVEKKNLLEKVELQRSEIFEYSPIGIIYFDFKSNKIIDCNKASYELYGFTSKKEMKLKTSSLKRFDRQPNGETTDQFFLSKLNETIEKGSSSYIFKIYDTHGNEKIVAGNAMLDKTQFNRVIYFSRDITEKYHSEQKLIASEQRFRRLYENNQFGILTFSNNKVQLANEAFCKMIGYYHADEKEMNLFSIFNKEDGNKIREIIERIEKGEHLESTFEVRFKHKITEITGVMIININATYNNDKLQDIIMTFVNITQKKYAQIELENSQKRYKNLLNAMPSGLAIFSLSGQTIFYSLKAKEILNSSFEFHEKFSLFENIIDGDRDKLSEVFNSLTNNNQDIITTFEFKNKSGKLITLSGKFSIMKDELFAQSIIWVFDNTTHKQKISA